MCIMKNINNLTCEPTNKERFQHRVTISVHNHSGHHRDDGQSKVLHGLTAEIISKPLIFSSPCELKK